MNKVKTKSSFTPIYIYCHCYKIICYSCDSDTVGCDFI